LSDRGPLTSLLHHKPAALLIIKVERPRGSGLDFHSCHDCQMGRTMKPSATMARIAALTTNASEFGSIRVSIRAAVSTAKAYQLGAVHLCEAVHIRD
jgi:hypothetical protein